MQYKKEEVILSFVRISLGLIFLWAFFDKLFGLGFNTAPDKSWLMGVSPTSGFLEFATKGPFAGIFKSLAGLAIIDWLFMLGLLLIGIALTFGIALKASSYGGAILMFLMWLAVLPKEHHPFLDEHVVYLLVFLLIAIKNPVYYLGCGKCWEKLSIVKKYKILR